MYSKITQKLKHLVINPLEKLSFLFAALPNISSINQMAGPNNPEKLNSVVSHPDKLHLLPTAVSADSRPFSRLSASRQSLRPLSRQSDHVADRLSHLETEIYKSNLNQTHLTNLHSQISQLATMIHPRVVCEKLVQTSPIINPSIPTLEPKL